ncbi:MAG: alpha/beta fold hydrolase [Kiritimatiellae bacterium]|nr:alpha/beta fold hydrolase [Kiritimatiellia bacterium]
MIWVVVVLLLLFSAVLLGVFGLLHVFAWARLYHPHRRIEQTPAEAGLNFEEITLVTADDCRLNAWWLPNPEACVTVLMCHGNTGNMGDCLPRIADLHAMGAHVLLFDYRGYGKSRGLPTERGLCRDAAAAYEWLRTTQYDNAEQPPIILFGHSLGGAVAVKTAVDKPVAGLILESTFTSIREIALVLYPFIPPWAVRFINQRFDSLSRIASVQAPILIAAASEDTLVPEAMGRRLFEHAREPKQFCELSGDHITSGWRLTPAFGEAVTEMIQAVSRETVKVSSCSPAS